MRLSITLGCRRSVGSRLLGAGLWSLALLGATYFPGLVGGFPALFLAGIRVSGLVVRSEKLVANDEPRLTAEFGEVTGEWDADERGVADNRGG